MKEGEIAKQRPGEKTRIMTYFSQVSDSVIPDKR